MRLKLVAVGGLKPRSARGGPATRAARDLCDDYYARLKRYTTFEEVELKPAPAPKLQKAIERATQGAQVVAFDPKGEVLTSAQFARRLERLASQGKGVVAFLIGGAEGLPSQVVAAAHERWSLSALTYPHRLARVVVAEQLYRAMTILRGEPYDK